MISINTNMSADLAARYYAQASSAVQTVSQELATGRRTADPADTVVANQWLGDSATVTAISSALEGGKTAATVASMATGQIETVLMNLSKAVY